MEKRNENYMLKFAIESARQSYKAQQEVQIKRKNQKVKISLRNLKSDRDHFIKKS